MWGQEKGGGALGAAGSGSGSLGGAGGGVGNPEDNSWHGEPRQAAPGDGPDEGFKTALAVEASPSGYSKEGPKALVSSQLEEPRALAIGIPPFAVDGLTPRGGTGTKDSSMFNFPALVVH
ncbi:unnamed protein product [Discosporangium mesarthrocarpum]